MPTTNGSGSTVIRRRVSRSGHSKASASTSSPAQLRAAGRGPRTAGCAVLTMGAGRSTAIRWPDGRSKALSLADRVWSTAAATWPTAVSAGASATIRGGTWPETRSLQISTPVAGHLSVSALSSTSPRRTTAGSGQGLSVQTATEEQGSGCRTGACAMRPTAPSTRSSSARFPKALSSITSAGTGRASARNTLIRSLAKRTSVGFLRLSLLRTAATVMNSPKRTRDGSASA